jgi:hypothetical protein
MIGGLAESLRHPISISAYVSGSTSQDFYEFTPNSVMGFFWRQHLNSIA